VRHTRSNASRPRQFYALFADRRAQAAEVFAEAPNGGFEPCDPAQQDRVTEIGAHMFILSKSGHLSK
jgi:hypothetical protein